MKPVTRRLAVLVTCVGMTLPVAAAPGLLSKFVNYPLPAAAAAKAAVSPNEPGMAN